jgi:hypothetical protein
MTKIVSLVTLLALSFTAHATAPRKKNLSPEFTQAIQAHQAEVTLKQKHIAQDPAQVPPARPFSELEDAGYIFFSVDTPFNSRQAKQLMAQHLPEGVTLVLYGSPGIDKARTIDNYKGVIDASRIRVIELDGAGQGFWARDGMPIPVWSQNGAMDMVDSRYYHGFEPDQELRSMFGNYVYSNEYYYEGGNIMVNDQGVCIMVDNDEASQIPEDVFTNTFGCKQLFRMPHEKGIGHIDETIRWVKPNTLVTDSPTYATIMRNAGFEVLMLPRPNRRYETYVNGLLVNGTFYAPIYNQTGDQLALDVYRSAGLNVVPIETITLSNNGLGSIHCITMTYPKVPFNTVLNMLGATEL